MKQKEIEKYSFKYYKKIYGKKITYKFWRALNKVMKEHEDVLKKLAEM